MHIEFLLEEESAEDALLLLLPKILPESVTFQTHVFSGKKKMKAALPNRLKGYASRMRSNTSPGSFLLVVLIDRDEEDCKALKEELNSIATDAGLIVRKHNAPASHFHIVNRIAIEELEAWFFGDILALTQAYPGVPATLLQRATYRNPDGIPGGTAESLLRALQKAGYYVGLKQLPKREVARTVAAQMNPYQNASPSFNLFCSTLTTITHSS